MGSNKFFLGASMSGHQVNGGPHDQWTAWEKKHAKRFANAAAKRFEHLPNWASIRPQATSPKNYLSGNGVEHNKHYETDFTLMKKMGLDTLRFSIEWADLEPIEGSWDRQAVSFYHQYFKELKARGIRPFPNLWHWTHPQWFEALGGMARRQNLAHFERFARFVLDEFGQYFDYVTVMNEPNVYTSQSYLTGEWPPQSRSAASALRVYRNLAVLQRRIYRIAKSYRPALQVGIVTLLNNIQPKRPDSQWDKLTAAIARNRWNWWFLSRTKKAFDFIGVNYYFTDYLRGFRKDNPKAPLNDMGWYMEPGGLEVVLNQAWRRYRKPLIVTETGVADAADQWRGWWIKETLSAVRRAQAKGAEVIGYLHWSLLDNFEWSHGWWPKFGLIAVDHTRKTMPRTIRDSAKQLKI